MRQVLVNVLFRQFYAIVPVLRPCLECRCTGEAISNTFVLELERGHSIDRIEE